MRPAPRSPFLALVITVLLSVTAVAQTTGSRSLLGGRLTIELPADWVRMTPEERAGHAMIGRPFLDGFRRPDGTAGVGILHGTELLESEDPRAIRRALVAEYQADGRQVMEAQSYLIGHRTLNVLHIVDDRDIRRVEDFIGATAVDGRLLRVVFTATGPELESRLLEGQIALGSLYVRDVVDDAEPAEPELADPGRRPGASTAAYGSRRAIPGTGVTLSVPDAFYPSYTEPGFTAGDGHTYIVVAISGLPRSLARHDLDVLTLRRSGMDRLEIHDVDIGGRRGDLGLVRYDVKDVLREEWILIVGDGDRSLQARAGFRPDEQGLMRRVMEDALRSLIWDPSRITDPLEDLGIFLEESRTLRIRCRAHDRIVLATKGNSLPLDRTLPYLVVNLHDLTGPIDDPADFASVYATRSLLVGEMDISSEKTGTIGGLPSYELTGTAIERITRERMDYVQTLVMGDGRYCVVQGFGGTTRGVDLSGEFAAITASIRLRREPH